MWQIFFIQLCTLLRWLEKVKIGLANDIDVAILKNYFGLKYAKYNYKLSHF